MWKFAALLVCGMSASAAMAQTHDPIKEGHAIQSGVDKRVDARVAPKIAALEQQIKELKEQLAAQSAPQARSAAEPKSGEYAVGSQRWREFTSVCRGSWSPQLADEAARKLDGMTAEGFQKQMETCPKVAVAPSAAPVEGRQQAYYRPPPAYGKGVPPRSDTFDNVSAGSLQVRSHGRDYDLVRVNRAAECLPPRQLVRTNKCWPIGNGGVRCASDCR
ncbi:MAG: hypothetical protein KGH79_00190 [Patescibacteria group bacterium]|nr:hypothetical protein [Patescibacteria group bacterium]